MGWVPKRYTAWEPVPGLGNLRPGLGNLRSARTHLLSEYSLIHTGVMNRARPMAPEERRKAIIAATTQLVLDVGPELTTRQIADACGLAEGTLFRAFDSKRDILTAVVEHIIDPASIVDEIAALPDGQSLPDTVAALVESVDSAMRRVRSVMAALHSQLGGERPHGPPHDQDKAKFLERHAQLLGAMALVLAPYTDELRVDPDTAAAFIQTTVFASGLPMLGTKINDRIILTDLLIHALVKEPTCSATH